MIHASPRLIVPCAIPPLALDRRPLSAQSLWIRARKVESYYAARLRKIAHYIDMMVRQFDPSRLLENSWIVDALRRYGDAIEPWARSVGERMVSEVAARDRKTWFEVSERMGRALHQEIEHAPIGHILQQRMADQVGLITSIPREAAERVHELTLRGITEGERPESIAKKIMEGGHVSRSKAMLIAATEVSRTQTELTKARAESVGSVGYIWSTVNDASVRPSHRAMQGKFVAWSSPPTLDGMVGHAGCLPRCRCICLPQIPDFN